MCIFYNWSRSFLSNTTLRLSRNGGFQDSLLDMCPSLKQTVFIFMKFRKQMDALAVGFLRSTFVDEKWTMMTILSTSWRPVLQHISCRGICNPFRKAGETSLKNLDADLGQDRDRLELAADFDSSPPFIVFFPFSTYCRVCVNCWSPAVSVNICINKLWPSGKLLS